MIEPKVAVDTLHEDGTGVESLAEVCRFRDTFYRCLGARADARFELADALLCAEGPVRTLVDLSLAPEHRRGHGAPYDGLNQGTIEIARLRRCVPRFGAASARRLLCPVHGRAKGSSRMIPGWAYSVVAALGERARQLDRGGGCPAVGTGR